MRDLLGMNDGVRGANIRRGRKKKGTLEGKMDKRVSLRTLPMIGAFMYARYSSCVLRKKGGGELSAAAGS